MKWRVAFVLLYDKCIPWQLKGEIYIMGLSYKVVGFRMLRKKKDPRKHVENGRNENVAMDMW